MLKETEDKVYTESEARAITILTDGILGIATDLLEEQDWGVYYQFQDDYWEMEGDTIDNYGERQHFEVRVDYSGFVHMFGSPPKVVEQLVKAMATLVGPYVDANLEW